MTKKPKPPSRKKPFDQYLKYSATGFQMLAIILIGVFIGDQLDEHFPISDVPVFTTLFSLIFVGIAMWIIIRQLINKQ